MFQNSLLINSIETEREKYFNYKCNTLLNFYSKDTIIEACYDLENINSELVSNALSLDDICYALIKKYYISNYKITDVTSKFNMYIEQLAFENAHQLIIENSVLRQELLNTYFENMNISNGVLSIEKAEQSGYDRVNTTLAVLNNFYLSKRLKNNISEHKVLKKSYN